MTDFLKISDDLTKRLELVYLPVGINLYRDQDALPEDIPFAEEKMKSYCQAVASAGKGRAMLLEKTKLGCTLGTSVLGFEEMAEDFLEDGVTEKYGAGLFATEKAAAETMLKSTYLPSGQTKAAYIAPLSAFRETPQVVVFSANSEQIMWLLYAANFESGGAFSLYQSGGALGGCSDITAWPILKGKPNVTFLGLGCRMKSELDACHLMMGIPGLMLAGIHTNILSMTMPIAMLRKALSKKD
jgi:uncharacterized protein (DUF169 family)